MNPFRRYRKWQEGEFVLAYCDTSWGGLDYSAGQFLSKDRLDVPLVYHARGLASDMTPLIHQELEYIADTTKVQPVISYERNNGGVAELERLKRLNKNGKYRIYTQYSKLGLDERTEQDSKMGHDTNSATRPTMLAHLKDAIDHQLITIYDKLTIEEMFSFVVKLTPGGNWKAEAEVGAHDDLIMSLAGAWQMYQTEDRPREASLGGRVVRTSNAKGMRHQTTYATPDGKQVLNLDFRRAYRGKRNR
jgi:hypothetical protein